jgi:glycosyltransferase involved in cell wall biosynthesis
VDRVVKTVCLIEYPEQWEALERRGQRAPDGMLELYCTTREAGEHLAQRGAAYRPLTEDVFASEWDAINRWAREAALGWCRAARWAPKLEAGGINLGDALYRPVSHRLVFLLRRQLLLEHLFRTTEVRRAVVFENFVRSSGRPHAPEADSVNALFLARLRSKKISHETVACTLTPAPSKRGAREIVRAALTRCYAALIRPRKTVAVISMGSVGHLADALEPLAREEGACFIDENFQLSAYRLCRARKIPYYVHRTFLSVLDNARIHKAVRRCLERLEGSREELASDPVFEYEGRRLKGVADSILDVFRKHGVRALEKAAVARKGFEERRAGLYLSHEDTDACRSAALTVDALGKKAVILSHGIPPVPPARPAEIAGLSPSVTLVNSSFEKDKYLIAGYSESRLAVTGLPRYDAIHCLSRLADGNVSAEPVVLYCPHHLSSAERLKKGYLGIRTPGAVTRSHTLALMRSCREIGARLWIKLHYADDIEAWKTLVRDGGGEAVRLVPHNESIFRLLQECDAVVSTFSTVTIEALLFGKPALTLNFSGREDLHPYAEKGIAIGVYREEDLAAALRQATRDPVVRRRLSDARASQRAYFGGFDDGRNTERVLRQIRSLARSGQ